MSATPMRSDAAAGVTERTTAVGVLKDRGWANRLNIGKGDGGAQNNW
jgi:hypothetical protein